jgi:hypothetical protein
MKTVESIKDLYAHGLLDKFETRNVVIKLSDENINEINSVINMALLFEQRWLQLKSNNYMSIGKSYAERVELLNARL